MGLWVGQAQWVGPTPNVSGPMDEQRGMVLHVMQGSLAGSIAWGKNPASRVSFHFGTSKAGACQQLVDTDVTAWTQGDGNGSWVSVENEDFSGNPLNAAQVENVAHLYARGVREYSWPYQLANSPSGRGLGYHAMGGVAWGNHPQCPGQPIIDQRGLILVRAEQINGGAPPEEEDDMKLYLVDGPGSPHIWLSNGLVRRICWTPQEVEGWMNQGAIRFEGVDLSWYGVPIDASTPLPPGGGGDGPTLAQITEAVRVELNKTEVPSVPGRLVGI